jgi:hypothetical protein
MKIFYDAQAFKRTALMVAQMNPVLNLSVDKIYEMMLHQMEAFGKQRENAYVSTAGFLLYFIESDASSCTIGCALDTNLLLSVLSEDDDLSMLDDSEMNRLTEKVIEKIGKSNIGKFDNFYFELVGQTNSKQRNVYAVDFSKDYGTSVLHRIVYVNGEFELENGFPISNHTDQIRALSYTDMVQYLESVKATLVY